MNIYLKITPLAVFCLLFWGNSPIHAQTACGSPPEYAELYVRSAAQYAGKVKSLGQDYWNAKANNDTVAMAKALDEMENLDPSSLRDLSDAVITLEYLFLGKEFPKTPDKAHDFNGDGQVNISDPIGVLNHLFSGQSLPDGANIPRLAQKPGELSLFTQQEKLWLKMENLGPSSKEGKIYQNVKITVKAQDLTPELKSKDGEIESTITYYIDNPLGQDCGQDKTCGEVHVNKISENGCFKEEIFLSFQERTTSLFFIVPDQWKSVAAAESHKFYNPEGFILFYKPNLGVWIMNTSPNSQARQLTALNGDQMGRGAAADDAPAEGCSDSGLPDVNNDGELNDTPETVLNEVNKQFNQCNSQPPTPAVPGPGTDPSTPTDQSPQGWSLGLSTPACPTPPKKEEEHSVLSWIWAGIKAIGSGACSIFDGNRGGSGRGSVNISGAGATHTF